MARLSASIVERVPSGRLLRATRARRPPPRLMPWTHLCKPISRHRPVRGAARTPQSPHLSLEGCPNTAWLYDHISIPSVVHETHTTRLRHLWFHLEVFMERLWRPVAHYTLRSIQEWSSSTTHLIWTVHAWDTWYDPNPYLNLHFDSNKWSILTGNLLWTMQCLSQLYWILLLVIISSTMFK